MSVSNVGGVRADITEMLNRIREVSHRENVFSGTTIKQAPDFSHIMESSKSLVNNINEMQSVSEKMKDQYLSGNPNVSLAEVVVTNEKSKLAFEGLMVVRNKCLEAYKEIMNMPV